MGEKRSTDLHVRQPILDFFAFALAFGASASIFGAFVVILSHRIDEGGLVDGRCLAGSGMGVFYWLWTKWVTGWLSGGAKREELESYLQRICSTCCVKWGRPEDGDRSKFIDGLGF